MLERDREVSIEETLTNEIDEDELNKKSLNLDLITKVCELGALRDELEQWELRQELCDQDYSGKIENLNAEIERLEDEVEELEEKAKEI